MINDVSGIPKYSQFGQFSFAPNVPNISTGNPIVDQAISMLLMGKGLNPFPYQGQSIFEAQQFRDRSLQILRGFRTNFGDLPIFQKFGGFNTHSLPGAIISTVFSNPDGLMNNPIIRAINGGNPQAAYGGLMKDLTGMTMGIGFGRYGNLTSAQGNQIMRDFYNSMYTHSTISAADISNAKQQQMNDINQYIVGNDKRRGMFSDVLSYDKNGGAFLDTTKFNKLRDATANFTKKLGDKMTDEAVDEFKKVMNQLDTTKAMDKKIGQSQYGKIDIGTTRGFAVEDLTRAYSMSADLGLFSVEKGRSPNDKFGVAKFLKNSAPVLRAMADLTGASTAQEAMSQLNGLIGNTRMSLQDDNSAAQLETLLRQVKGLARSAGISMDVMTASIKGAQALQAQSGMMSASGGLGALGIAARSVQDVAMLSAAAGNNYVRDHGGTNQMLTNRIQDEFANQSEEGSLQVKALFAGINGMKLPASVRKQAMKVLSNYANNKSADHSLLGMLNLQTKLGQITGLGQMAMKIMSEDKGYASEGARQLAEMGDPLGLNNLGITQSVSRGEDYILRTLEAQDKSINGAAFRGMYGTVDQRMKRFRMEIGNMRNTGKSFQDIRTNLGITGPGIDEYFGENNEESRRFVRNIILGYQRNTVFGRNFNEQQRLAIQKFAEEDKETAKRLAVLQAPILQTAMQGLISGDFSGGIDGLLDVIENPGNRRRAETMMRAMQNAGLDKDSFLLAFQEVHGGAGNLSDQTLRQNLYDQGFSGAMIDRQLALRSGFTAKNFDALSKTSSLTVAEVMNSGRSKAAFKKSKLGDKGYSFDDLSAAAQGLMALGIDDQGMLGKYGSSLADKNVALHLLHDQNTLMYAHTLGEGSFNNETARIEKKFKAQLELDGKDPAKRKIRDQLIEIFKAAGLAKFDTSASSGLRVYDMGKALQNGDMSVDLQKALIAEGFAPVDANGKITSLDEDSLYKYFNQRDDNGVNLLSPKLNSLLVRDGWADIDKAKANVIGYDMKRAAQLLGNPAHFSNDGYKKLLAVYGTRTASGTRIFDEKAEKAFIGDLKDGSAAKRLGRLGMKASDYEGYINRDSSGNIINIKSKQMAADIADDEACNYIRNQSFAPVLAKSGEDMQLAMEKADDIRKAVTGDKSGKGATAMDNLQSTLSSSSTKLVEAITKLTSTLNDAVSKY